MQKESLLNVPNLLTMIRGIGGIFSVYLVFAGYSAVTLVYVFIIFAVTDGIDGWIARRFNQTTKFGKYFDPVVDRIFMVCFVLSLTIKLGIIENKVIFKLLPIIMMREIVSLPALIFIRRGDIRVDVKEIGKKTTLMQSITVPAVLLNLPYTYVLIIATGLIGILAGIDYSKSYIKKEKK